MRDHEENKEAFAGPRFLIRAAELDMHPLDARDDRADFARDEQGIGMCNITKCCTEVCPEHIKITDNAIIPMKERVVGRHYDPLVWLGHEDRPAQGLTPLTCAGGGDRRGMTVEMVTLVAYLPVARRVRVDASGIGFRPWPPTLSRRRDRIDLRRLAAPPCS